MTIASLEQLKAAGWMKEANHIGGEWVLADVAHAAANGGPFRMTVVRH